MAKRNVVDFRIVNIPNDDAFKQLEEQGKVDPNAMYVSPDTSLKEKHITNCITEIPQDIKLEIVDGAVVLKAGSKGYRPNGAGVFNQITASTDISRTTSTDGVYMVVSWGLSSLELVNINSFFSGATQPVNPPKNSVWYDTTNNVIKETYDSGATWGGTLLFPLGIVTVSNGSVSSIDQVFNGFGYIGSCVFTLPGVRGLYPNGRNEDGTLKNGLINCTDVQVSSNFNDTVEHTLMINPNGRCAWYSTTGWYYNDIANVMVASTGTVLFSATLGTFKTTNGVISNFNPHEAFHAVDYNDFEELDNSAVHKTGNETVAGIKTFTSPTRKTTYLERGVVPSTNTNVPAMQFMDKNSKLLGELEYFYGTNGTNGMSLLLYDSSGNRGAMFRIGQNSDGTTYASAPTPASTSNSTEVATTAWSNAKFLPLAGGTMSGNIICSGTVLAKRDVDNSYLELDGGTSRSNCAYLVLFGGNKGSLSGCFQLGTGGGTIELIGKPDGSLLWANRTVIVLWNEQKPTSENNYTWYRKYSDGWVEQGGWIEGGENIASSVAFPIPMTNTYYSLSFGGTQSPNATSGESPSYRGIFRDTGTVSARSTTGFTLGNGAKISWYVCGYAAS